MIGASCFETKGVKVNELDEPFVAFIGQAWLHATSGSITRKWRLAGRGDTHSYLGQQVRERDSEVFASFCAHTPPGEVVLGALKIPGIKKKIL